MCFRQPGGRLHNDADVHHPYRSHWYLHGVHHEATRQHGEAVCREPLQHAHDRSVCHTLPETIHHRRRLHHIATPHIRRHFHLREGQPEDPWWSAEELRAHMEVALSPKSAANRAHHPRRYQFYGHVSRCRLYEGYYGVLRQNTAGRGD